MIQIMRFWDAPEDLRKLSDHGGDEEDIIMAPESEQGYFDSVVERVDQWSWGDGTVHKIELDGVPMLVYITAHA